MIEQGSQNHGSFHLAGVIPIAGQPLDFNFPWHDSLMPVGKEYLALERAVAECAMAGCETIWIVCHKETQPLVRERIGEWVYDPVSLSRGPLPSEEEKQIPIFYVPVHPKDRDRRDCLGWSVLYGALSAYHISRQLSKWVIPDKYYVSFPYGVYPVESLREHRKMISSSEPFSLTHEGKSIKSGEYLGFTFDAEDFKRCRTALRKNSTARKDAQGNTLSLEKRYSARHFPLDIVFKHVIMEEEKMAHLPWYFRVDSWDSYSRYLGAEQTVEKPERMKYNEWNPIGHDGESL